MVETGPASGGGAITGVIGAFKTRLDFLAILVLNICFLGVFYFIQTNRNEQLSAERISLLDRCFPTREEKN
jgi:hypothetical protein